VSSTLNPSGDRTEDQAEQKHARGAKEAPRPGGVAVGGAVLWIYVSAASSDDVVPEATQRLRGGVVVVVVVSRFEEDSGAVLTAAAPPKAAKAAKQARRRRRRRRLCGGAVEPGDGGFGRVWVVGRRASAAVRGGEGRREGRRERHASVVRRQ